MRVLTWLPMVVATAILMSSATAWSCPARPGPRASPPAQLAAAPSAAAAPVHHLSHWRGPHGERWTVAAQVQTCAELDLEDLARIGGVEQVRCRRVAPHAVTLVVPTPRLDEGQSAQDWLGHGVRLEQIVPADVPVDVIGYDVADGTLQHLVRGATPAQAFEEAQTALLRSDLTPLALPMHTEQPVIEWLARGVVTLGVNGHERAVILVAPTLAGPPGVAAVQRALQLMPDAQYTVLSSSRRGRATTPQLSGISNAGYLSAPADAETLHRVVFQRFELDATGARSARTVAETDAAVATLQQTPTHRLQTWLLVVMVLWYVFGLKLAMYLMLRSRAQPVRVRSRHRHRRP